MKKLLKNKIVWVGSALILIAAIFYSKRHSHSDFAPSFGTVTRGELIQRVSFSGSINPNRKTLISAPYNGYVRNIYVKIGQKVKAGDPIVSVAQSLKGSGDDVFPLRAPFAGVVVQILKTEGEYVDQSSGQGGASALVRIDDLSRLFVESFSPEIEVSKLKTGQDVIIKASAVLNRSYQGKITQISLAAREQRDWDRSRVEFPVQIEITDKDDQLEPGMSVVIDIIANKRTGVLKLAHEFVQKEKEKYFVVTEAGVKKEVSVGMQNEEEIEITQGVSENESIRQVDFLSALKEGL